MPKMKNGLSSRVYIEELTLFLECLLILMCRQRRVCIEIDTENFNCIKATSIFCIFFFLKFTFISRSSKHFKNCISNCFECIIKIDRSNVVVNPISSHDGGEKSVLCIGKSSELVIDEVDESRLSGLEDTEVSG